MGNSSDYELERLGVGEAAILRLWDAGYSASQIRRKTSFSWSMIRTSLSYADASEHRCERKQMAEGSAALLAAIRNAKAAKPSSGNLKPAPFELTEGTVAKLVGDRPAYGKGVVRVPVKGKVNAGNGEADA